MTEANGGKTQKPQGKPHTGMIEFRYSKIVEDYEKMKSTKFDMEAFKRMHPKKEGMDVVLHKYEDKLGHSADLKIFSYILRSGNFGTPAPVNMTSLPLGDSQLGSSLPSLPNAAPRAPTQLSMASAALSRVSKTMKSSSELLPSIKSNSSKRNTFMTEANRNNRGGKVP